MSDRHPSANGTWRRSTSPNSRICSARILAMAASPATGVCSILSVVVVSMSIAPTVPATHDRNRPETPGYENKEWEP
jgi:hypothetical protein